MDREVNNLLNRGKEIAERNETLKQELDRIGLAQQSVVKSLSWEVKKSHNIILATLAIAHRKGDKELIEFLENSCITIAELWDSGRVMFESELFEELIKEGKVHQTKLIVEVEKDIQKKQEEWWKLEAEIGAGGFFDKEDDGWAEDPSNPDNWYDDY